MTTVPVLALAAVVEARRASALWTARRRRQRLVDGCIGLTQATAYVGSFTAALLALSGTALDAMIPVVTIALVVALCLLSAQPLLRLVVRGNGDIGGVLEAWWTWLLMRRAVRGFERVLGGMLTNIEGIESIQQHHAARLESIRQDALRAEQGLRDVRERLARTPQNFLLAQDEESFQEQLAHAESEVLRLEKEVAHDDALLDVFWADLFRIEEYLTRAKRLRRIARSGRPTWRHRRATERRLAGLEGERRLATSG